MRHIKHKGTETTNITRCLISIDLFLRIVLWLDNCNKLHLITSFNAGMKLKTNVTIFVITAPEDGVGYLVLDDRRVSDIRESPYVKYKTFSDLLVFLYEYLYDDLHEIRENN